MKKILFAKAAGLIMTIVLMNNLYAQNSIRPLAKFTVADLTIANSKDLINPKAVKNFNKHFKSISDASWFQIRDGFLAQFSQGDITSKVFYDKKGNWDATLRSYGEKDMPVSLRRDIRSQYFDYRITVVDEIEKKNRKTFVIHLENNNDIVWLWATQEAGFEVMKYIRKS